MKNKLVRLWMVLQVKKLLVCIYITQYLTLIASEGQPSNNCKDNFVAHSNGSELSDHYQNLSLKALIIYSVTKLSVQLLL